MLHVAEEANLRQIKVSVIASNYLSYIVGGHNFYIAAKFQSESRKDGRIGFCTLFGNEDKANWHTF